MQIVESFCTASDCYKKQCYISPVGLMIHSVGCPQPDPKVFYKNWDKSGTSACAHAVLGADGVVLQLLPWNMRGWHAGGTANNTHIGVEMTEPSCIKYTGGSNWVVKEGHTMQEVEQFARATYREAVKLFARLCIQYNINPLGKNAIISHKEGCALGVASNHGDVEHIWKFFEGMTMSNFRNDINARVQGILNGTISEDDDVRGEVKVPETEIGTTKPTTIGVVLYRVRKSWDDVNSQIGAYTLIENAKDRADKNPGYKVFDETGKQIYPTSTEQSTKPAEDSKKPQDSTDEEPTPAVPAPPIMYRVRKSWADKASQIGAFEDLNNAIRCADSNKGTKVFNEKGEVVYPEEKSEASANGVAAPFVQYRVKVKTSALNIRKTPNGQIVGVIRDNGVYTIVEENAGWGRLASGAGWICISDSSLITRLN